MGYKIGSLVYKLSVLLAEPEYLNAELLLHFQVFLFY